MLPPCFYFYVLVDGDSDKAGMILFRTCLERKTENAKKRSYEQESPVDEYSNHD